jgi:hypothetical protein
MEDGELVHPLLDVYRVGFTEKNKTIENASFFNSSSLPLPHAGLCSSVPEFDSPQHYFFVASQVYGRKFSFQEVLPNPRSSLQQKVICLVQQVRGIDQEDFSRHPEKRKHLAAPISPFAAELPHAALVDADWAV